MLLYSVWIADIQMQISGDMCFGYHTLEVLTFTRSYKVFFESNEGNKPYIIHIG